MSAFRYEKDADGIVTVTMDMAGPVNAMNAEYREAMGTTMDRLEADSGLTGVVITSAKNTFFAGGDLREILGATPETLDSFIAAVEETKQQLRRLEHLPVPVAAAINGAALGGGLEIALACNHRVVWQHRSAVVGLPEVTLGLLPGGGGVVRVVNLLGLEKGLPLMLEGRKLKPDAALKAGLVDAVEENRDALVDSAKAWIQSDQATAAQPWDRKGHAIPGGTMREPAVAGKVAFASAMAEKNTRGLLPAPIRIIDVASQATLLDFDAASKVESRGLGMLAITPQAKNLITTLFFQLNDINGGSSRPKGIEPSTVKKLGVLGAGMMGQGIAYSAAMVGIEVKLLDVSLDAAKKGKGYTDKLLQKAISRGRMTEDKASAVLARITATDQYADLDGCDFIVEAVFESVDIKATVTRQAEPKLAPGGIFGTNTSTLPISQLAEAAENAADFIGIHFFSPVDKMPLVELICGEKTSDEALAKAFDFARQIGKTAIVVNDSLGFYTSRTIGTFLDESCRVLTEGVHPTILENLIRQIGMPAGPLTVFDEVSLELMRKVNETHKAMGVFGSKSDTSVSDAVGQVMINEHQRGGRHYGGGFYEYAEDGSKTIWPGLLDLYYKPETDIPDQDVKDRVLFRQVIESIKCLEEGVLRSAADGNIGSIMGIGAPMWTGGFLQYVNTYGLDRFVERTRELESLYGDRFAPPSLLLKHAEQGKAIA